MRYAAVLIIGLGLLTFGCASREQVIRVTSPNGRVDAVVFESDCGVLCDVLDEVWVVPKGARKRDKVAWFDDSIKSELAWGVNVRWEGPDRLSIEYLRARQAKLLMRKAVVAGQDVGVTLRGNVSDPLAPPGDGISGH